MFPGVVYDLLFIIAEVKVDVEHFGPVNVMDILEVLVELSCTYLLATDIAFHLVCNPILCVLLSHLPLLVGSI